MMNSFSNCIISKPFDENNNIKPNKYCLKLRTNKNIKRNNFKFKNYLTLNLNHNTGNKDSILSQTIYQTIKNENKKMNKIRHLKENSRNIINSANESKESKSNKSFIKPQTTFKGTLNYKNTESMNTKSFVHYKKIKKLNNSKSNQCFTENNYNISNNKIIIPIYQSLFGGNKLNNRNFFTTNNSIKKIFKEKNEKININLSQVNNEIIKKDAKIINKKNNKSTLNNRKKLKFIKEKLNLKIKDKNHIAKEGNEEFKKFFDKNFNELTFNNQKINKINNLNKSENLSNKKSNGIHNIKKLLKSKMYKNRNFSFAHPNLSIILFQCFNILNKIFKKRKQEIWETFKYKILDKKDYQNNNFKIQSLSYNNFQSQNYYLGEQLLNNKKNKRQILLKDNILSEHNIYIPKFDEIYNYTNEINEKENIYKNDIIKKLQKENMKLKINMRKIYIKYLLEKQNQNYNDSLRRALYKFNKNRIIINNIENRKHYLLKKLIQSKDKTITFLLRRTFIKFNFKCKLLTKQRKTYCFKNFQDDFLKMQKLSYLIYQKEKYNILLLQKYFNNFRINTILKQLNIIDDKRKRKLKLIISKITNYNNNIIKSILKQWLLRSKIIKFRISDKGRKKYKEKNIIKNENLIKGLNKLNNIFKAYTKNNDKNDEEKIIKKNIINENDKMKIKGKKYIIQPNTNEKQNYLKKLFLDKYCTDYILEEKDEE